MEPGTAPFTAYSGASGGGGFARTIRDAIGEVAALLFGSTPFAPHPSVEQEVQALVAPHLAILIHKRRKFAAERWAKEIDEFVGRIFFWPASVVPLERSQLAALVDRIVAQAQEAADTTASMLPQTSRFDSSWAD
jgi:hypothetical protein